MSTGDNALYLREWAADIRAHNGKSVDADRLDAIAGELEGLRSALAWVKIVYPAKNRYGGASVDMTWDEWSAMRRAAGLAEQKPRR